MPKAPTSPTSATVKSEPYPSDSPSKSPTKAKGGQVRGVTFTEEMDKEIIHHILSISDINLRYNWPDLVKNKFPNLTTKQASNLDLFSTEKRKIWRPFHPMLTSLVVRFAYNSLRTDGITNSRLVSSLPKS